MIRRREYLLEQQLKKEHIIDVRVKSDRAYHIHLPDIHRGLDYPKLIEEEVEYVLGIPQLTVTIGGDAANNAKKNSKGNPKEEWKSGWYNQILDLGYILQPLYKTGQLKGIIQGNHLSGREWEDSSNIPEYALANAITGGDIKATNSLYKGEMAIMYYNVNKNTYVHFIHHKASKRDERKFYWVNADVEWREHHHDLNKQSVWVMEHNKFARKPIIKEKMIIHGGHWLLLPHYVKIGGYQFTPPGAYVVEMSGEKGNWGMFAYTDNQFNHIISHGYKV